MSRDLNVMFPLHGNLLSENEAELRPIMQHPPSPPFRFDILCHHVVFREDQIKAWIPDDARYVAILRQPWERVSSAFSYYRVFWPRLYLRSVSNVSQLVKDWRLVEPSDPLASVTNNRMSIDLGLPPEQLRNSSYVPTFVSHLHGLLDLVLIVERIDESLVLMKRRFRWTMKDILYMKLNEFKTRVNASSSSSSASLDADPQLKEEFKRFNQFDVAVYGHFVKVLEQEIQDEGSEFSEELRVFTAIRRRVSSFCTNNVLFLQQLNMPRTKWNEPFTVQLDECTIFTMDELELNAIARYSQLLRMTAHMYGN